jgi:predicted nucleic acid-binding protein
LIYLDTSFLAPFYIREATSESIEAVLLDLPVDRLAISDWTRVEFTSLLTRRVRMGRTLPIGTLRNILLGAKIPFAEWRG